MGRKGLRTLRDLGHDKSGAALIEYTALTAILVIAVLATILLIGGWISATWTTFFGLLP